MGCANGRNRASITMKTFDFGAQCLFKNTKYFFQDSGLNGAVVNVADCYPRAPEVLGSILRKCMDFSLMQKRLRALVKMQSLKM
jgi:hypothetical protein